MIGYELFGIIGNPDHRDLGMENRGRLRMPGRWAETFAIIVNY